MATATVQLPAEIFDQIIDHLHSDSQTLANCAVVCRQFLPSSRWHAFEKVYLHPLNAFAFSELLDSPHCTLINHVRQLDMEEGRGRYPNVRRWFNETFPRLHALSTAPVERLIIRELTWDALSIESQNTLLSMSHKLEYLSLNHCTFSTSNHLAEFIASSPKLAELELSSVNCLKYTKGARCANPPFGLKSLVVDAGPVATLLPWLLTSSPKLQLTHAKFGCVVDRTEARTIREFLAVLGSSVTHLELGFGVAYDAEHGWSEFLPQTPNAKNGADSK